MIDQRADILLVEDNPDDVELTLQAFKTANLANTEGSVSAQLCVI